MNNIAITRSEATALHEFINNNMPHCIDSGDKTVLSDLLQRLEDLIRKEGTA